MKNMFKAFAKKIFGARYERAVKSIVICFILFWSLCMADIHIRIAPAVLYLMTGLYTAGVMWQALSSEDNAANMMNLFMLPFDRKKLIYSYVGALGSYTILTKTLLLLSVTSAVSVTSVSSSILLSSILPPFVSVSSVMAAGGSILCALNAVILTANIFSLRRYRVFCGIWAAAAGTCIFLISSQAILLMLLAGNLLAGLVLLGGADAYSFYRPVLKGRRFVRRGRSGSVWIYLIRYLAAHKNYLANTAAMWAVACVMPGFFVQMDGEFMMPVGFAVLSMNTPICILLSCDPSLEQAVRMLPGQKKSFCVPYCMFIFSCNMAANIIFLCSWQIQIGGITVHAVLTAFIFALQSAVGSVLLEWFCPLRDWKIESDLWHHPRKYVVPAAMLLTACGVGILF